MYWGIALKNIFRSRTRSLVTVSAIAVGCISLIIAGGFIQSAIKDVREGYIRAFLGHIQIYKRGFYENGVLQPFDFMMERPGEIVEEISRIPGLARVAPRVEFAGLLSTGETTTPALAQGVDPRLEISPMLTIIAGQNLAKDEGYDVILGAGLAKALRVQVGDSLALLATTQGGAINGLDLTVRGIFRSGTKAFDDRALRLPLRTAQKLLRTQDIQRLTLFLDNTEDTDAVQERLHRMFSAKAWDLEAKAWHQLDDAEFAVKLVDYYERLFIVFKMIIFLVVVLSVFNTMNMSVLERVGEIGTIMALGIKTKGVLALFLAEGLILGLFGGILGLSGGYALANLLSYVGIPMGVPPTATVEWIARIAIVPEVFVFAFFQALATSLISSSYPAWRASRLEIAEALRHNV